MQQLGYCLGGQGLAGARWAVQEEDAASTFAANDVLEGALLVLHQTFDERFALGQEHQLIVGLFVVFDLLQVIDC